MNTSILAFQHVRLLQEDGTTKSGSLFIDKKSGLIIDDPLDSDTQIEQALQIDQNQTYLLSPSLIDIQINGAYSIDFSQLGNNPVDAINEYNSGLDTICSRLSETGVTSFLPTLFTSHASSYPTILSLLRPSRRPGARILGFHAEGPFMNPLKKGAHQEELMKEAEEGILSFEKVYGKENVSSLKDDEKELVRIITLAPEVKGVSESISELTKRGIRVAIGHSNATYEEAEKAVQNGASLVTHLFNAMAPLSHRAPGLVGFVLSSGETASSIPNLFFSLIADGIHVSPHVIKLSYRANSRACVLITDALPPLDPESSNGHFPWSHGKQLRKEGDALYVKDTNTLAGSCASLSTCVRNLSKFASIPFAEALLCATLHPAQFLGMEKKIGRLAIGNRADLCLWDEKNQLKGVWIGGKRVVWNK